MVDETIIAAPLSIKNAEQSRDPRMHQTKKGSEWRFGMKERIGVDTESSLENSLVGTAAKVSDVSPAHAMLHGHKQEAFANASYVGVGNRDEVEGKTVKWRAAVKRRKIRAMRDVALKDLLIEIERTEAQFRARVEHQFPVVKSLFQHRKECNKNGTIVSAASKFIGELLFLLS